MKTLENLLKMFFAGPSGNPKTVFLPIEMYSNILLGTAEQNLSLFEHKICLLQNNVPINPPTQQMEE